MPALLTALFASAAAAEVKVAATDGGGATIAGETYTAAVDAEGNLASLKVGEVEFLGGDPAKGQVGGAFPGKFESLEVAGATVTVAGGGVTVAYAFDATGFNVTTEGATLEYHLAPITAAVALAGNTGGPSGATADVRKVVIGRAAIALDKSFHFTWGRLWPSHVVRGRTREEKFTCRVDCGVAFEPVELVLAPSLTAKGHHPYKVPYVPKGEKPQFEFAAGNLGTQAVAGELVWTLKDHYYQGRTVAEKTMPAEFPAATADKPTAFAYEPGEIPQSGFYWVRAEFRVGGKTHKSAELAFLYDADAYKPPLTRPADFAEFWARKLAEMRELPFDAALRENAQRSTEHATWYDLEMTVAAGKRLAGFFSTPKAEGKYPGMFSEIRGEVSDQQLQRWAEEAKSAVFIGLPWPDVATFRTWTSRDENNMLDCYLLAVRMADYLRSRSEVDHLVLKGGSRSGPLVLVAAALDPAKVRYVDAHVPTSMGISWRDKVYRGWGGRAGGLGDDEWFKLAAYVDPINFAPDLKVPFLMDGGIYDDLAPAPGIQAFYNHATQAPWKRCSIERGGHGYFSNPARKDWPDQLRQYLEGH